MLELLDTGECPQAEAVKKLVVPPTTIAVPELEMPAVDLSSYDGLLGAEVSQ